MTRPDVDPAQHSPVPHLDPAQHWEERYGTADRVWSGRPNVTLVDVLGEHLPDVAPGRALDLGCGEGGDAVWLARQGWRVTGVDISPTATRRATEAARERGLDEDRARFIAADLTTWDDDGPWDLVTASFFQSTVELPRGDILRRVAGRVAPGGHLLLISHAAPPPWATGHDAHGDHPFRTPAEDVADLALDPDAWDVVVAETRTREATGHDGQPATLDDTVVLVRAPSP